ncbi:MAG: PorT family protein [Chitinophagales bacterium]|nr:PorT family protein [Chitinophagales bacterium]
MKRILSTVFSIALLGFYMNTYAADKDNFQFGVRMGAQFSKLAAGDDADKIFNQDSKYAKSLVGPAFGFIFEIPVMANFEIRPELNFGSQGQRFKLPNDITYSYWMGYVQVPILLRGQFGNETVRGFLHAGPQFGYGTFILDRLLMKGGEKQKESYSFDDQKLKPFDAGIAIGVGAEFPKVAGMEVEVRYYLGMSNINDYGIKDLETKNRSLHLTLAFKF